MKIKLSIIVPIYDVEEYLPRCIDSILAQKCEDFELILVDDGSPDNCPRICDEYAGRDDRVSVIHQPNRGVSMARNAGMKAARGDYITFVDGDDYILADAYEKMIKEMENNKLDILSGRGCRLVDGKMTINEAYDRKFPDRIYPGAEFMHLCLRQGFMATSCCMNIYDRKFLLDNELFFVDLLHEDELWIPQVFLKAQRVKYINRVFYVYLLRQNSRSTAKDRTQNGIDLLGICYELEKVYARTGNEDQRKYFNDFLLDRYLLAVLMGKLYRAPYRHMLRRGFVRGKPLRIKNKIKAGLFFLSPELYVKIAESRLAK